jgi:hypothetical protein
MSEPKLAASARDGSSRQAEIVITFDPASVTLRLISPNEKSAGDGMCKSKTTTFGFSSRIKAIVCGKSSASPTILMSGSRFSTSRIAFRSTSLSSAMSTVTEIRSPRRKAICHTSTEPSLVTPNGPRNTTLERSICLCGALRTVEPEFAIKRGMYWLFAAALNRLSHLLAALSRDHDVRFLPSASL